MIRNLGRRADSMDPNDRVILNEARYSDHIEESQEQRKHSNAFNTKEMSELFSAKESRKGNINGFAARGQLSPPGLKSPNSDRAINNNEEIIDVEEEIKNQ